MDFQIRREFLELNPLEWIVKTEQESDWIAVFTAIQFFSEIKDYIVTYNPNRIGVFEKIEHRERHPISLNFFIR